MKFFHNRTVTSVICILLSLAIFFVSAPSAGGNRSNKDVVESEAAGNEF